MNYGVQGGGRRRKPIVENAAVAYTYDLDDDSDEVSARSLSSPRCEHVKVVGLCLHTRVSFSWKGIDQVEDGTGTVRPASMDMAYSLRRHSLKEVAC